MRKLVSLAAAIATSASVIAMPAALAYAAAPVHVLTINKVRGPAVKVGAVLKSGLKKNTKAVFSLGSGTIKLSCKSAHFSAKVKTNPVKPGKATESITALSTAKCTFSGITATLKSLKSVNLPYKASVSDATGFPVTITGSSSTKPVKFSVKVAVGSSTITCNYKASSVKGHASNTGNKISFSKQKFSKAAGSNALCVAPAFFSATFGPVRDTSVTNSPKVFVN
jgi:uncharacterized Zn-binding protein involved in type VI secretion